MSVKINSEQPSKPKSTLTGKPAGISYKRSNDEDISVDQGRFLIEKTVMSYSHDIYFDRIVTSNLTEYNKLFHYLLHSVETDERVNFHLNNVGGDVETLMTLISYIRRCKGHIVMVVESNCYSAGAILALAGHNLTINKNAYLMFHNYSWGYAGKAGEFNSAVENTDRNMKQFVRRICQPFLTNAEINKIFSDKDVYINPNDSDFMKRIKRHFK